MRLMGWADLIQVNALIPALLAGNSVLLKPSPQTPLCAERILASLLHAGVPLNVCQVCTIRLATTVDSTDYMDLRFSISLRRRWTLSSPTLSFPSSHSPDQSRMENTWRRLQQPSPVQDSRVSDSNLVGKTLPTSELVSLPSPDSLREC